MERDLRGVGDVAEERPVEVEVHRTQQRRRERGAERLALAVDVGVVRAGEVDALEHAGAGLGRLEHALEANLARGGHQQRHAGRQLADRVRRTVQRRLDRGPLGGDRHRTRRGVIPAGADAVRVAHRKRPAVARHPAQRERAVELGKNRAEGAEDGRFFLTRSSRSLNLTRSSRSPRSLFWHGALSELAEIGIDI